MKCDDCPIPKQYDYGENVEICSLFGWDNDDGCFQFILPFFLAWLIVLPGTMACEARRELEMRRYEKDWREGKI